MTKMDHLEFLSYLGSGDKILVTRSFNVGGERIFEQPFKACNVVWFQGPARL